MGFFLLGFLVLGLCCVLGFCVLGCCLGTKFLVTVGCCGPPYVEMLPPPLLPRLPPPTPLLLLEPLRPLSMPLLVSLLAGPTSRLQRKGYAFGVPEIGGWELSEFYTMKTNGMEVVCTRLLAVQTPI